MQIAEYKGEYFVCTVSDFDHEVIDVTMIVDGHVCYVKGFDDEEWEDADKYAKQIAEKLNLKFVGDVAIN